MNRVPERLETYKAPDAFLLMDGETALMLLIAWLAVAMILDVAGLLS